MPILTNVLQRAADFLLAGCISHRLAARTINARTKRLLEDGLSSSDSRRKLDLGIIQYYYEEENKRLRSLTEKARMALIGVTLTLSLYIPSVSFVSSTILRVADSHGATVVLILILIIVAIGYFFAAGLYGLRIYRPAEFYFPTLEREADFVDEQEKKDHLLEVIDLNRQKGYLTSNVADASVSCIRNGIVLSVAAGTVMLWLAFDRTSENEHKNHIKQNETTIYNIELNK
jgi:hypothetical protein